MVYLMLHHARDRTAHLELYRFALGAVAVSLAASMNKPKYGSNDL